MNIRTITEHIAEALCASPIVTTHELAYYTENDWDWLTPKQNNDDSKQQQRIITNAALEGLTRHAKQAVGKPVTSNISLIDLNTQPSLTDQSTTPPG